MSVSDFDQRSGIVVCDTVWGKWWQTVAEVYVEISVTPGTRAKDCMITIKPKFIECKVHGSEIFKGELFETIITDESTWTLEEQSIIILLAKAKKYKSETVWNSLLIGQYIPNLFILQEMMKKLDLEQMQIENPGFDFSGATLSKQYDNLPTMPLVDSEERFLQT